MHTNSTVLIWDWDGTLLDTRPAFEEAFKLLQKEFSLPYFTAENFEILLKNWGAFWENCPLPEAMYFYRDAYKTVNKTATRLMPNAQEVLSWAKKAGFKQILVSNKVQWAIEEEVEHFKLTNCFLKVQGVESGLHPDKKPSRTYGEKALTDITHTNRIVIGDSVDDITFAQNLSAICLYLGEADFPNFNGQKVTSLLDVKLFLEKGLQQQNLIQHHTQKNRK